MSEENANHPCREVQLLAMIGEAANALLTKLYGPTTPWTNKSVAMAIRIAERVVLAGEGPAEPVMPTFPQKREKVDEGPESLQGEPKPPDLDDMMTIASLLRRLRSQPSVRSQNPSSLLQTLFTN